MSRWEDGEVVKTSEDGRFRLRIVPDQDPQNPRENGDYETWIASVPNRDYYPAQKDQGPYGPWMKHLHEQYGRRLYSDRFRQ